ncbi:MAG: hypothetical protein GY856_04460 [bacterium]|nr:hypothetical protein [bacterium]
MACYRFHDLELEVKGEGPEIGKELAQLLEGLSWVPIQPPAKKPPLRLAARLTVEVPEVPPAAREAFRTDGFRGLRLGDDFYLSDGTSLLRLQVAAGRGSAYLAPAFFDKSPVHRQNFWVFGVVKLLRSMGLFYLHAGALDNPHLSSTTERRGLLIVGASGSGKSTLTIGLIRQGWRYLTDDAVLLRRTSAGVEALAFRKHFAIDAREAGSYGDLPLAEEMAGGSGLRKRRVRIDEAAPGQHVPSCRPAALVFPRLVPEARSTLCRLDRLGAVRNLLAQSGIQAFDRATMPQQLELLAELAKQAVSYELLAGTDLHRHPEKLVDLLAAAEPPHPPVRTGRNYPLGC